MSFLGCLNNRLHQMRKMAKAVALRLAEKAKEEKAKELQKDEKTRDNKNIRNRSTNIPSNYNATRGPSNTTTMNKSGSGLRKP